MPLPARRRRRQPLQLRCGAAHRRGQLQPAAVQRARHIHRCALRCAALDSELLPALAPLPVIRLQHLASSAAACWAGNPPHKAKYISTPHAPARRRLQPDRVVPAGLRLRRRRQRHLRRRPLARDPQRRRPLLQGRGADAVHLRLLQRQREAGAAAGAGLHHRAFAVAPRQTLQPHAVSLPPLCFCACGVRLFLRARARRQPASRRHTSFAIFPDHDPHAASSPRARASVCVCSPV